MGEEEFRFDASMVDEYRWARDSQDRREQAFSGGNKTERDSYYGRDREGDAHERRLTYKDWLKQHKAPEEVKAPWDREYSHGWEMGQRHGEDLDHAPLHEMPEHLEQSDHPDHFFSGYSRGLELAVPKRFAVLVAPDSPFNVVAHISGNQVDLSHCPFCGSGSIIGRSDGTVECGYCTSVFTVQIQPSYNGFPQSVDGQPYEWPGRPDPNGAMAEADVPEGTNLNPNNNGDMDSGGFQSSDPADGGDEDGDDEDADDSDKPAFLKGKGDSDDKKSDNKKGKNPFAKKKSYRTSSGAELDEDNYLAHLAINFADDPAKVASLVKASRRRDGAAR
jgi:hypothetical protein